MADHSPRTSAQPVPDQSAFDAGRKRAADWFAQHGHSLAIFRDLQRAAHVTSIPDPATDFAEICRNFDAGFAAGIADFIRGVSHG